MGKYLQGLSILVAGIRREMSLRGSREATDAAIWRWGGYSTIRGITLSPPDRHVVPMSRDSSR